MEFKKKTISVSDSGSFLKISDGESVSGVLAGELYESYGRWENKKFIPMGNDEPGGRTRYKANFVVYEGGKFVAKIWDMSVTVNNQLADLHEEYGDLTKIKLKITRHGSGMSDTVYNILPAKDPLTPKQLAEIEKVPLSVLNKAQKEVKNYAEDIPMPTDDDQLPF